MTDKGFWIISAVVAAVVIGGIVLFSFITYPQIEARCRSHGWRLHDTGRAMSCVDREGRLYAIPPAPKAE